MEPSPTKEEIKQEDTYTIVSNNNHSFHLTFQNLNSIIGISASYQDDIKHNYDKKLNLNELKQNQYFMSFETIDEIYIELISLMKKNQTKIIEEINQIYINIPVDHMKIKEITFVINEITKNYSEKINELFSIMSNIKQKMKELKENIKNDEIKILKEENQILKEDIKNLKEEIKNMKENNFQEMKDLKEELKKEINKQINENKEKEMNKTNENKEKEIKELKKEGYEKEIIQNLDSLIIKDKDIYNIRLKKWICPNKIIEIKPLLLYRLSRDGNNYEIFHKNCDNKGPTLILIKTKEELIIGGFTLLNWDSNSKWKKDNNTFIFSLTQNKKYIKKENNSNSIYCLDSYGPMFDNFGFECNERNKFMKECKFNPENVFFNSYDIIPNKGKDIYFDVEEVEIYSLFMNFIICEYNINNLNQSQTILNSFSQINNEHSEDEINSTSCEMYLNDKKINFDFKYQFNCEDIYRLTIVMKKLITNMNYMFYQCYSLISLDLSNFNTNNIKDMSYMFSWCFSLTSLNVSNFNNNNVINMSYMFSDCRSLTTLDLSNFNTNNVTYMSHMFYDCSSLTSLNLSNFNTNNVINMSYMFCHCSSLTSLNVSNFNTKNVTNMSYMFSSCSSLTSLNLSNFNTNNVEKMNGICSVIVLL